jgi:glycerol transport system ATP-binding protein
VDLAKSYSQMDGNIELGIRPEFVSLSNDPAGVPVQVTAVEDIGRYKIVRAQLEGQSLDAVIPEGASIPAEPRATLDKARINIYKDSHLVREGA